PAASSGRASLGRDHRSRPTTLTLLLTQSGCRDRSALAWRRCSGGPASRMLEAWRRGSIGLSEIFDEAAPSSEPPVGMPRVERAPHQIKAGGEDQVVLLKQGQHLGFIALAPGLRVEAQQNHEATPPPGAAGPC